MPLQKKQTQKPLSAWSERLKAMQEGAKAAMENYNPSAFVQVPDGIYIAKETCELSETKPSDGSDPKMKINRRYTILEGEQANLSIFDGLVIENNETGLHIARRWVEQHGIEWPEDDMAQLEEIISQINQTAPTVKIRSRTTESKDGTRTFTNVTVSQILEGYEASPENIPEDPAQDDLQEDPTAVADDKERLDLLTFAASQGIDDVNDSMGKDDIAAALAGWQFSDDQITADENALLENIGLAGNIIRKPKPPVKKVVQQMPKAPVKPLVKQVAKKR
jgi:hypothetical protein